MGVGLHDVGAGRETELLGDVVEVGAVAVGDVQFLLHDFHLFDHGLVVEVKDAEEDVEVFQLLRLVEPALALLAMADDQGSYRSIVVLKTDALENDPPFLDVLHRLEAILSTKIEPGVHVKFLILFYP